MGRKMLWVHLYWQKKTTFISQNSSQDSSKPEFEFCKIVSNPLNSLWSIVFSCTLPRDKSTHKLLDPLNVSFTSALRLFSPPIETWLSSSQTGLDRLSRARDAALCRSRPAASSHYQIHLFEDFSLKADKSGCHGHFSPGRVSFGTRKIMEDFGFGCGVSKWVFSKTACSSSSKSNPACLLIDCHIFKFMIIQHVIKAHAGLWRFLWANRLISWCRRLLLC